MMRNKFVRYIRIPDSTWARDGSSTLKKKREVHLEFINLMCLNINLVHTIIYLTGLSMHLKFPVKGLHQNISSSSPP